jgi:hypothetical protein
MASVPREFVTVDMRDLKVALIELSRVERVSVSSLVRDFVSAGLGRSALPRPIEPLPAAGLHRTVKLSIRVSVAEWSQLSDGARQTGLSRAAYLAELIAGAPHGDSSGTRSERLAMLAASNAELSTLNRNVRHLADLIGQGSLQAARQYGDMLHTIANDVRHHLESASALMADMRPRRRSAPASLGISRAEGTPHG